MTDQSFDERGEAHEAMGTVVSSYGARVLSNPQMLRNLVADLLPDLPRERSLLVSAAEAGIATEITQYVEEQHIDAETAVQLVARALSERTMIDATASMWVATEFAQALGYAARPFGGAPARGTPVPPPPGIPGLPVPPGPPPAIPSLPQPPLAGFPPPSTSSPQYAETMTAGQFQDTPAQYPEAGPASAGGAGGGGPVSYPQWAGSGAAADPEPPAWGGQGAAADPEPPAWGGSGASVPNPGQPGAAMPDPGPQGWGGQGGSDQRQPGWGGSGAPGQGQPGPGAPGQGQGQGQAGWGAAAAAAPGPGGWPASGAPQGAAQGWAGQGGTAPIGGPAGWGAPGATAPIGGAAGWPPPPGGMPTVGMPPAGMPAGGMMPPGGMPAGGGPYRPAKPPGGRRGPLIAVLSVVGVLVLYFAIIAPVASIFPFGGHKPSAAPSPSATAPVSLAPTPTPSPVGALAPGVASLTQLLPADIDQPDTECEPMKPPYHWDNPGLVQALSCTDPGLSGGTVYAYQLDSAADFTTAFKNFNKWWGLDFAKAGTNCPPAAGQQGTVGWNDKFFPQRANQSLECSMVGSGTGAGPAYAYAYPTEDAFILAQAAPGTSFKDLDTWWTNNAGPAVSPTPETP
jgi:hypothetical protein